MIASRGLAILPLLYAGPPAVRMAADEGMSPENWFVQVPMSFEALGTQAARAVSSGLSYSRRLIVEAAAPELDPASPSYKPDEMIAFARDLAELSILNKKPPMLPTAKPHVKLLFGSTADATMAGAGILTTSLPCLLYTSPSPRDGLLSRMPSSA